MAWKHFHNRGEILKAVVDASNQRRDGRLPMEIEGVAETFGDELTLLAALQLKWYTRLSGQIERRLVHQPHDRSAAVQRAWGATAEDLPGVRLILDHHQAQPSSDEMEHAMNRAAVKEHTMLAVMAGRAGAGESTAARLGSEIEAAARRRYRPSKSLVWDHTPANLLHRMKSAIASA